MRSSTEEGANQYKISPRGKIVRELLEYLEANQANESIYSVVVTITSKVYACLDAGNAQQCFWSSFHELRNSASFKTAWSTVQFPQSITKESALALQLIADCMLKQMVANKAEALSATSKKSATVLPKLDAREKNAVRYMSGYVAVTLLKKHKKPTMDTNLQLKRSLYVKVLQQMQAEGQTEAIGSIDDYTRYWSELIDRGGLYHISDKVRLLFYLR